MHKRRRDRARTRRRSAARRGRCTHRSKPPGNAQRDRCPQRTSTCAYGATARSAGTRVPPMNRWVYDREVGVPDLRRHQVGPVSRRPVHHESQRAGDGDFCQGPRCRSQALCRHLGPGSGAGHAPHGRSNRRACATGATAVDRGAFQLSRWTIDGLGVDNPCGGSNVRNPVRSADLAIRRNDPALLRTDARGQGSNRPLGDVPCATAPAGTEVVRSVPEPLACMGNRPGYRALSALRRCVLPVSESVHETHAWLHSCRERSGPKSLPSGDPTAP